LKKEIANSQDKFKQSQTQLSILQRENTVLAYRPDLSSNVKSLQEQLERAQQVFCQEARNHGLEMDRVRKDITAKQMELDECKAAHETVIDQLEQCHSIALIEVNRKHIEDLEAKEFHYADEHSKLSTQIEQQKDQIASLSSSVSESAETITTLTASVSDRNNKITVLNQEIAELRRRVSEVETSNAVMVTVDQMNEVERRFQHRLTDMAHVHQKMELELAEAQSVIQHLQYEKDELLQKINSLSSEPTAVSLTDVRPMNSSPELGIIERRFKRDLTRPSFSYNLPPLAGEETKDRCLSSARRKKRIRIDS
jgi:chromosome segregation ATPase